MDVNMYVIIGIIIRSIAILLPVLFVVPMQIRELKRPNMGYNAARAGLLYLVGGWIIFLINSMPYMVTRVYSNNEFSFQNFTSLTSNILGLSISMTWVWFYRRLVKGVKRV